MQNASNIFYKLVSLLLFFCASLTGTQPVNSNCGESDSIEKELTRLTEEIHGKQQEIISLLKDRKLKASSSLYELVFKNSPPDIRESLAFLMMSKVKDEKLSIKENHDTHDLFRFILDPNDSAKHYKLRLADIFFFSDVPEFKGLEQGLYNDVPLGFSLSDESKSFYIMHSTSLMRFLYLNRWLED